MSRINETKKGCYRLAWDAVSSLRKLGRGLAVDDCTIAKLSKALTQLILYQNCTIHKYSYSVDKPVDSA